MAVFARTPISKEAFDRNVAFELRGKRPGPRMKRDARRRVLDNLLGTEALRKEAKRVGVTITERQADTVWRRVKRGWGRNYERAIGPLSDEDFKLKLVAAELLKELSGAFDRPPAWIAAGSPAALLKRWRHVIACREGYESSGCQ